MILRPPIALQALQALAYKKLFVPLGAESTMQHRVTSAVKPSSLCLDIGRPTITTPIS